MNYFFFVEILEAMYKIFQEYFLDDPFFKWVAIEKSIQKTTSRKSIFKVGSSESINRILEKKFAI